MTELNRRAVLAAGALAGAAVTAASAAGATAPNALAGRRVLITGASSGFGRLTALHLSDLGATVVASMRNLDGGRRPEAASLLAEARGKPGPVHVVEIDVTRPGQVTSGVAEAERLAGGGIDVLFSNAGIGLGGPMELQDEAALELQLQTNLLGGLRMARAVLPGMRRRKAGLIIPVSSQLGRLVLPNIGGYCTSKFGLEAAFEAMAYEVAPFGVEVTIVQPGGYPTNIWNSGARTFEAVLARTDAERRSAYAQHIAMTQGFMQGPRDTDPMDVPRAVAALIGTPAGQRPLRRPVHRNIAVTEAANAAMARIQAQAMASGPYAPWHAAVTS
jgi:NAD(P)-dependent dehydrogenase (short-subunit alcohol dehydrogenase family)